MILLFLKNILPSGLVLHKGNACQKEVQRTSGQKYGWFQRIFVLPHSFPLPVTRSMSIGARMLKHRATHTKPAYAGFSCSLIPIFMNMVLFNRACISRLCTHSPLLQELCAWRSWYCATF